MREGAYRYLHAPHTYQASAITLQDLGTPHLGPAGRADEHHAGRSRRTRTSRTQRKGPTDLGTGGTGASSEIPHTIPKWTVRPLNCPHRV
jgi:hypothetical protein